MYDRLPLRRASGAVTGAVSRRPAVAGERRAARDPRPVLFGEDAGDELAAATDADPFEREYGQDWLDYQHEIGLRHHRAKENVTDGFAESAAHVPFRWLVPLVYPMAQTIRPFLHDAGAAAEEADAIAVAFTKSLLLQITLWSRAYVGDAEW